MNFKELNAFLETQRATFKTVLATVSTEEYSKIQLEDELHDMFRHHVECMMEIARDVFPTVEVGGRCRGKSSSKPFTPPSSRSPPSKVPDQSFEEFMEEIKAKDPAYLEYDWDTAPIWPSPAEFMEMEARDQVLLEKRNDLATKPISPPTNEPSHKATKKLSSSDPSNNSDLSSIEGDSELVNKHTTAKSDNLLTPTPLYSRKTQPQVSVTPVRQQTTRRRSFNSAPKFKQPERGQLGGANKLFGGGPVAKPSYNRKKKPEVVHIASSSESEGAQAEELEEESDEGLFANQRKAKSSSARGRKDGKRAAKNTGGDVGKLKKDWMTSHILILSDDDDISKTGFDADGLIETPSKKRKRYTTARSAKFRQIDEEDYVDSSPLKKEKIDSAMDEPERTDRPGWKPLSPQKIASYVSRSVLSMDEGHAPISDDIAGGFTSFRTTVETDVEMEEEIMKDDDAEWLLTQL